MKNITLLLLIIALLSACGKDDDTTQNIVRCKINGEEWRAYTDQGGSAFAPGRRSKILIYNPQLDYLDLKAKRYEDNGGIDEGLRIEVVSVQLGNHKPIYGSTRFFYELNEPDCIEYNLDTLSDHNVTILSIDTENWRMEGTFGFTAVNEHNSCGDYEPLVITDGYFNLGYEY